MTGSRDVVFLLDVDNTLLDSDRVVADLRLHLDQTLGARAASRYWEVFECARGELGYVDYLGALLRYRSERPSRTGHDPRLLDVANFLIEYPFAERLYPGALAAISALNRFGRTVILSDGDQVFQPLKIRRAGLWQATSGRVLVCDHKETMLESLQQRYPARHYLMFDDKLRVLTAMKGVMGNRLTAVFTRQGGYASDPATLASCPAADLSLERIGDLLKWDLRSLLAGLRGMGRPAPRSLGAGLPLTLAELW
ncbi:MAG TPA: HAD family hydrolase [Burkholderiaceae bacterium]|nr:HAD family hydrolase [Burkholderiaceae bacterium]